MEPKDRIALNFFPLAHQEFDFSIYRRLYNQSDEKTDYPVLFLQKTFYIGY
jgi:hypothetical protein